MERARGEEKLERDVEVGGRERLTTRERERVSEKFKESVKYTEMGRKD